MTRSLLCIALIEAFLATPFQAEVVLNETSSLEGSAALEDQKRALNCLLESAKLDYISASETFKDWMDKDCISVENIDFFFTSVKEELDKRRYKNAEHQKIQIVEIVRPIDLCIAEDLHVLIDRVIIILQDLKINYHNIQHTLEVALGVTETSVQCYKEGLIKDPKMIMLPIVAALFHDIGYSNAPDIISYMQKLPLSEFSSLFYKVKDPIFLEEFKAVLENISDPKLLSGAEFHFYHVHLSQILLPWILGGLPSSLVHQEYILSPDSLEKINAMIALTDIKPDPKEYRKNRRQYLLEQDCLFLGEIVATCDLFTQLVTSDRLGKSLALYHELFLAKDDKHWESGLVFMESVTGFYEFFAKRIFDEEVIFTLDRYFSSHSFSRNPYRTNMELVFFLHKIFGFIYQKILTVDLITDQDIRILKGLEQNGLQKEIVDLFLAAQILQNDCILPKELKDELYVFLKKADSFLEVALADEIRITLMRHEALSQDSEKMKELFVFKKPGLLIKRSFDLLTALQMIKSHPDRENIFQTALEAIESIPEGTVHLAELKKYFSQVQGSFLR